MKPINESVQHVLREMGVGTTDSQGQHRFPVFEDSAVRSDNIAYHVSGADFEKFIIDGSKGLGDKIFGYGIYFSSDPDEVNEYINDLRAKKEPKIMYYEVDLGEINFKGFEDLMVYEDIKKMEELTGVSLFVNDDHNDDAIVQDYFTGSLYAAYVKIEGKIPDEWLDTNGLVNDEWLYISEVGESYKQEASHILLSMGIEGFYYDKQGLYVTWVPDKIKIIKKVRVE